MKTLLEKIKQAIIDWDNENISSLIEEDVKSLAKFITERLEKK